MNHKPTMTFSKSHQVAPSVGFRVAGSGDGSGAGRGAPVINAAEGSTVVYAAPGATIGHLAGLRPSGFRAEGTTGGWLDRSLRDLLSSETLWMGLAIGAGILLLTRRRD